MPIKVRIKNFQSIEDAEIDIEGFTVISGSNNTGKTAVMRAIRGVFTNTPGTAFVRWGAESSSVTVEMNDHKVTWEKGEKIKPSYTIQRGDAEPRTLHPGRGVPEEVSGLGVSPIRAGNADLWPQVAQQFSGQIFLLDKPGSTIAEAVADVERVGTLNDAMRQAERDMRKARETIKVRLVDVKSLQADLDRYDGLDDVDDLVADLESRRKHLNKVHRMKDLLTALNERRLEAMGELEVLAGVESIVVPDDEALRNLSGEVRELEGLHRRWVDSSEVVRSLEGVDALSLDLPDESKLLRIKKAIHFISGLSRDRNKALDEVRSIESEMADTQKELAEAEAEVVSLLEHMPECPVCGAPT